MAELHVDHDVARAAVLEAVGDLVDAARPLDDRALLAGSRCRGWSVADVLAHVHLGLQEMLHGLVTPTSATPNTDAASYWAAAPPTNDPDADDIAGIRFVRLLSSAYRRPTGLVAHLGPTADAVSTAVASLRPGSVRFQGHVMTTGDFLATWACEVAVHHLDIGVELPVPDPAPRALTIARATIEALAGGPLPAEWTDVEAVLLGAGRIPVQDAHRRLGPAVAALPVLGPPSG
jgi:uncharacterized protein (TIGR03083 family)